MKWSTWIMLLKLLTMSETSKCYLRRNQKSSFNQIEFWSEIQFWKLINSQGNGEGFQGRQSIINLRVVSFSCEELLQYWYNAIVMQCIGLRLCGTNNIPLTMWPATWVTPLWFQTTVSPIQSAAVLGCLIAYGGGQNWSFFLSFLYQPFHVIGLGVE